MRLRQQRRDPQIEPLYDKVSEMLVEARAPDRTDQIAGLQHRAHMPPGSAPHQPEMTAMLARHQFEDGVRLPMAPDPEHDAFIGPLHR